MSSPRKAGMVAVVRTTPRPERAEAAQPHAAGELVIAYGPEERDSHREPLIGWLMGASELTR